MTEEERARVAVRLLVSARYEGVELPESFLKAWADRATEVVDNTTEFGRAVIDYLASVRDTGEAGEFEYDN